jgi:DNA-binding NtrC family response regulator
MSGHGSVETAIEATRLGAFDFVQKPISLARLLSVVNQALDEGRQNAKPRVPRSPASNEPIGSSALMQLLRKKSEQAAQHDLPILITGEKGSGRENLARFIHGQSRHLGEFVVLEHSELVHENIHAYLMGGKHSLTGKDIIGVFERAVNGTLFIPELQEIPDDALKAIDQVLEAERSRKGDETAAGPVKCRLIASAGLNIVDLASEDERLQQLYYRLNVLPLQIPPLRERPDDVPELVRYYAESFPNRENLPYRPFSVAAQNRLRNHSWPGNTRELRNLVQQLLVLGGEGEVSVSEVEEALKQNPAESSMAPQHPPFFDLPLREAREQFEREYLVYKLREAGGSVGKLAESVGMERTHLYRKLRALGVDPKSAATSHEAEK